MTVVTSLFIWYPADNIFDEPGAVAVATNSQPCPKLKIAVPAARKGVASSGTCGLSNPKHELQSCSNAPKACDRKPRPAHSAGQSGGAKRPPNFRGLK